LNSIGLDNLQLQRVVIEVFGGCNYTCQMCPQSTGREPSFLRKMPLKQFEDILDQIMPYGSPVINLEGSGEPTMATDLPEYIAACTSRGFRSYMYCNGARFRDQYMRDCIDAGLSLIRFSVIGYNSELYNKWMSKDNFELIKDNARQAKAYKESVEAKTSIDSYHLILDPEQAEYEIAQYQNNFINDVGTKAYIWKMHNWSGNYTPGYTRDTSKRRTCGRPASAELTVRAGGLDGHRAAVTPCCQVLGPPTESKSVLGHLDTQTFEEVWNGELYNELRHLHDTEQFDKIDYCKGCDFLYEDPEVLVWTNDKKYKLGQPQGTNLGMNT